MDDFAQSREPDDLFADDIEPAEQQITETKSSSSTNPPPKPHPHQRHGALNGNQNHRGGRRGGQNGSTTTRRTDQATPTASSPPAPADPTTTADSPPPSQPPSIAAPAEENRITAVRGDRSATGPAKPTKKTEAELTELMKSMQLKNAAKTEAHARAEKDQASFLQREQQAAAKKVEERKAIREQDMERAKNRERKIRAQGGREWDSEKQESDIVDRSRGGSSMYSRGAHGGVRGSARGGGGDGERGGLASSRYGESEDMEESRFSRTSRGRGRGRGRAEYDGARGGRGGRGGRAGYPNGGVKTAPSPAPPGGGESDFPALPTPASKHVITSTTTTTNTTTPNNTATAKLETSNEKSTASSQGVADGDWADEMATAVEKT